MASNKSRSKKTPTAENPYSALAKRKPVSTTTDGHDDERVRRVFAMLADAHKTIREARLRLVEKMEGATLSELDFIEAKLLELGAQLKMIEAKSMVFLIGQAAIRPPTQSEMDKSRRIAQKLDADIAAAAKAKAIVATTTKALQLFSTAMATDEQPGES